MRLFIVLLLLASSGVSCRGGNAMVQIPNVHLMRTPDGGIQPQAMVDGEGTAHLIYYKGDAAAGDVYYVRRKPGQSEFSAPVRVNSVPESAIAIGNIRGAQLAVGKGGRVHVAWNGSAPVLANKPETVPMWYARLNDAGTAFEPQRNLITWAGGLDGGGSVAADGEGNVYVFWHAGAHGTPESERAVYAAVSNDEGSTFTRERQISPPSGGVCGCCSMRAFADRRGNLYAVYRAPGENVHRDTNLLVSRDRGRTFTPATVHPWELKACPMSSASFSEGDKGIVLAWQTGDQVFYTHVQPGSTEHAKAQPAPGEPSGRKHPIVVAGPGGSLLLAWTEGMGWGKGGSLVWQVYDVAGQPAGPPGRAEGVPVWSLPAGFVDRNGSFVLVY